MGARVAARNRPCRGSERRIHVPPIAVPPQRTKIEKLVNDYVALMKGK